MDNIILAFFAILFALLITYSAAVGYFEGKTSVQYQSDMNQPNNPMVFTESNEFSYGMWINVNKLGSYKRDDGIYIPTNPKNIIINRPGELSLFIENGILKMGIKKTTYEIMSNFPLQKWVYVTITRENGDKNSSFVNAYIDGKLIKSYQMTSQLTGPSTQLTIGRFDAKLVGLKRWKYPMNPAMVMNEYSATNLKKMLGNYNVDVSVLKDEKLSKRFTVF